MICWIYGFKPNDEVPIARLYSKFGVQEVTDALCTKQLRWYGHITLA